MGTDRTDFENLYLQSLRDALIRRRRAIKYRIGSFDLQRSIDRIRSVPFERLDLELKGRFRAIFHLAVWEDSAAWIGVSLYAGRGTGHFKVSFHVELWDMPAASVVRRVEQTLGLLPDAPHRASKDEVNALMEIWFSN